jgi:zinc transport system substrate-binding protein
MLTSPRSGRLLAAATAVTTLLTLSACAGRAPHGSRPVQVVAAFYPLQYVAEQIGGDRASVANLAPPGAEPHDVELSPRQVASIVDADVVVYLSGFQPAVDDAVALEAPRTSYDVSTTVPLLALAREVHSGPAIPGDDDDEPAGAADPHLWLDPTRLAAVARGVATRFAQIDPAGAPGYEARAAQLTVRLAELDEEYRTTLANCKRHEIVVSHAAFGYLAQRYGLHQIALSGLSPDSEPTPQRLAEVAAAARSHNATTIFFESLVSPKVAQAIAGEVGARIAVLDPIEGPPAGDYLTAMRSNLATLVTALGCVR